MELANDLYNFLIDGHNLSTVNAALVGIVFLLARQRYREIVKEFSCLKQSVREHEKTFIANGITIERERK
jgi:hypothetical protein